MARIFILGAGIPTPSVDTFGSSYVIRIGDDHIMFDCGPAATHKLVKSGLWPTQIDHLFFTHHHFDHDVDYPCFLLTRWDQSTGQENELHVFGPTLTEQLTHRLMDESDGAFAHDWIARINHPLSLNAHRNRGGTLPRKPPSVRAMDIGPGETIRGKSWEIRTARAEHVEPWLDSLAYRLDTEEGSFVVAGDTRPCQSVVDLARDADVMLCLCVDVQSDIEGTPEADYMCGSTAAGKMAQDAGAKKLVLVHQGGPLQTPGATERALGDVAAVYDGPVIWGRELMSFDA
ncbi:MAG: MBL fold metallo-hydrolase [SAR202 cluster bacterium]|jgi:ribonuclease BN (tRNA processing enzyme)|nr:MBL fold metallo-hydrolase [SAR202 cluster bacterium]MDP6662760.1 MBL fold metallo-hydrolase [SAR202 cluster bacterium]MQG59502.1 MBL fold metallo-hydrolase [SAR202 cluster bacterium]MQG68947.1 MBL fold metallo-hydrolase [SAR202 cluster bacterium]HAL49753.1 hypothetical protein [Dehalococcoidia bacterium]|tara:strand:+ start:680 stop:1543 length:864 start_codon:yes stop_codon:yes gene_type:complete